VYAQLGRVDVCGAELVEQRGDVIGGESVERHHRRSGAARHRSLASAVPLQVDAKNTTS
jgi:hypothetical protein